MEDKVVVRQVSLVTCGTGCPESEAQGTTWEFNKQFKPQGTCEYVDEKIKRCMYVNARGLRTDVSVMACSEKHTYRGPSWDYPSFSNQN